MGRLNTLYNSINFKRLVTATRFFLGLVFFTAGMAKLMHGQFPGLIGPVWLEERLSEYGLAFFARFIAYSQVIVGLLLLTQRFATLGAIMLFPMILNIFIVTVSLGWRGTPYVNFVLLSMNLFLLFADYHRLKFIFHPESDEWVARTIERRHPKIDFLWIVGVVLILTGLQFYPVSLLANYAFVIAGLAVFIACPFLEKRVRTVKSII